MFGAHLMTIRAARGDQTRILTAHSLTMISQCIPPDFTLQQLMLWPCFLGIATYLFLHFWDQTEPIKSTTAAKQALCAVGIGLALSSITPWMSHPESTGDSETSGFLSGIPSFRLRIVLKSYIVYLASLIVSVVGYRISPLHPLSGIPGPLFPRTSKLFGAWLAWRGNHHLKLKSWHDKYGPIVRTGPNEVSIVDADATHTVLGAGGIPKGQYYDGRTNLKSSAGTLLVLRGEEHANRRRLWNRGMGSDALKEYEGLISTRANTLIKKLEIMASSSSSIDIAKLISYFTFDFMADFSFGGGFELLRDSDSSGLLKVLDRFAVQSSIVCQIPWAAFFLDQVLPIGEDVNKFRRFAAEAAIQRAQAGASSKDLWYHLMDEAGLEKVKPPLANVVVDGSLAMVAGSDTTVSALSSLFYFLLSDLDCYRRLMEEVDAAYPAGTDPFDVSKHHELEFMKACINETLRLQPPLATNGSRQIPANSNGRSVAGWFLPPGTNIYIPPYSLHRDTRYWTSPELFMPDRWLDPNNKPVNSAAFIPFSYGPANCVGKTLAIQEMMMVMTSLLQRFHFSFAEDFCPETWPQNLHDHFVSTRGPLLVSVSYR